MFPQEEAKRLTANIGSLVDQLEQIWEGEEFDLDPELADLEPEEETGADLEAVFARLEDGATLEDEEVGVLEAAIGDDAGELETEILARLKAGEVLSADKVAILRAAVSGYLAEAEEVVKSIVARSLQGVGRQDAVPLLAGLRGLNRGGGMVRKQWANWQDARLDQPVADPDVVRLFSGGDSRVSKALPGSLQPELEEEDEVLLQEAVRKLADGRPLSEFELLEVAAQNQLSRPLALVADMPIHKSLQPFNRRAVPIESLQDTWREVDRMVREATRSSFLKGPPPQGRNGQRKEIVRKSLGAAVATLLGQRE